jgi:hypothetical protein
MCEMTYQVASTKAIYFRWNWLHKIGGVAALTTGMLLLIGMVSLIFSILQNSITNGWLLLFQNNWLVKIFILHAEFSNIHAALHGLNILDIVIMLLVSVICLSLSTTFKNASKVWSLVAFALSLIAIILFVVTQEAGRSTVMLAVLINSIVMLRDKSFSKVIASTGILASVFLFIGDLTVGIHSGLITIFFGMGYMLLTAWFFLIAQNLFRLDQVS